MKYETVARELLESAVEFERPLASTLNLMDHSQVAYYKQRYSAMKDDELVYLLAAKLNHLTEEAQAALQHVVRERRIQGLDAEVAATQVDLSAQAEYEAEERRKAAARKAAERKFVLYACGSFVVAGLGLAVVRNGEAGLGMAGAAAAVAAIYEIRRFIGKVIGIMFRMD